MFFIQSVQDGHVPPFLYMPCGDFVPRSGLALTMENGKLKIAAGAVKPSYICMQENTEQKPGEMIPVMLSTPEVFYQVISDVALTDVSPGDKVTISADGMNITAVKTGGVAEIIALPDTAAGTGVTVRFN